jgi:phosphoribosylformimino-5-aminoimidazole carboxamide ribonucleotide (ProFAR) isomerase
LVYNKNRVEEYYEGRIIYGRINREGIIERVNRERYKREREKMEAGDN